MKKLLLVVALNCCYFLGFTQKDISASEAKSITANVMANFTQSTSFAYSKGVSLDQFKNRLLGRAVPLPAGTAMIETAYSYLSRGVTKAQIVKENNGIAVANAFKYFLDQHNNAIASDGTEIFGGKSALENSTYKAEGCRWYQFWCHVQDFANWVVQNWPVIVQIIEYVLTHL